MNAIIFLSLAVLFIAWAIYDARKSVESNINKAVNQILESMKVDLNKEVSLPEISNEINLKYHDKFQNQAEKLGFRKLGDLISGVDDKTKSKLVTRVMVDASGVSLLAYARLNVQYALEQVEMETWMNNGNFLYSTNNPYIYVMKHPHEIKVNGIKTNSIASLVKSHNEFISQFKEEGFKKYDNIQSVASNMKIQSELRNKVIKTKEFIIEADEQRAFIRAIGQSYSEKILKRIYEKVREKTRPPV